MIKKIPKEEFEALFEEIYKTKTYKIPIKEKNPLSKQFSYSST